MRKHILEQLKVDEYLDQVPTAGQAFRSHQIDPSHLSLTNAAALVSAPTDEVLAVMEHRLRQAARQKAPANVQEMEGELVA